MQKYLQVLLCLILVVVVFEAGWKVRQSRRAAALPAGIVSGNGRLEATQVNVSTKEQGRVLEILAEEGDLVEAGQILARMDIATLNAELARNKAALSEAKAKLGVTESAIVRRESELKLAELNLERVTGLFKKGIATKQDFDENTSSAETAKAALAEEKATYKTLEQSIDAATADVQRTQTRIDDSVLKAPIQGRVLYRLAEPGEVLAAGGKVLTLVNLTDIYMEIFLPAQEAARVRIGADSRITLDAAPGRAAKAEVSFVAPEAQFTPKQVETRSERDKLMFRVKLKVPPDRVRPFLERIKTGVRGVGYVRYDDAVAWPESLETPFTPPEKS
jgi:HlyD family secretion protein